jgi:hypothetical protein
MIHSTDADYWKVTIVNYSRTTIIKEDAKRALVDACGSQFRDKQSIDICRQEVNELILQGFSKEDQEFMENTTPDSSTSKEERQKPQHVADMAVRTQIRNRISRIYRDILDALDFQPYLTTAELKAKALKNAVKKASDRNARRVSSSTVLTGDELEDQHTVSNHLESNDDSGFMDRLEGELNSISIQDTIPSVDG